MKEMSRRSFLKAGTAATAALALTPSELLAKAKANKKNANLGLTSTVLLTKVRVKSMTMLSSSACVMLTRSMPRVFWTSTRSSSPT